MSLVILSLISYALVLVI